MKALRMGMMACVLFLLSVGPAFAADTAGARSALETTINAVLQELKKPGLHDPGQRAPILANVEKIILTLFDFDELSRRTVGPSWKNFSPDQKSRFTGAFTDLLRGIYLEKLIGYNGEQVFYTGETASSAGDKVEIRTTVSIKGNAVPVAYRMMCKEKWVVYDIIIEGVSMVQNYRNQFQTMLAKGDAEGLIAQVTAKAAEVRAVNQKQADNP